MSESQSSKKKTFKKTSKTSTSTSRKKNSSSQGSASSKKGVKTEKKVEGFKKFHIPVKVINTPKIEERRMLQSVPETVESRKEESSNREKSSPKVFSVKKKKKDSSPKTKQKKEKKEDKKGKKEGKKQKDSSDQVKASDSGIKDFSPRGNKPAQDESPENSSTAGSGSGSRSRSFSFNMYRKLAVIFIVLTILLLAGAFYFSFPGLAITVVPQKEDVSDSLMVDIHDSQETQTSSSDSSIGGVVEEVPIIQERTFQSTGARTIGKEIKGKVRIINNYSQDQPLVKTTRLLSPDEKLYRLKKKVVVPAGGSKIVEIYTENPSPEMAIDSTKFTIPGLWAGLQDDIYAKSKKGFEYRVKVQRYVQQSDIDKALQKIWESLKQKAKDKFGSGYKGKQKSIFNIKSDSITTSVNAKVGDEQDEFTVKIEAQAQVAAFDNKKMVDLVSKKLAVLIPDSKELSEFKEDSIDYKLEEFNPNKGMATVKSSFQGKMVPAQDSDIIEKDKITELNKEQLISYLDNINGIKDYQLDFSPTFLQKVPNLTDRIKINIKTR